MKKKIKNINRVYLGLGLVIIFSLMMIISLIIEYIPKKETFNPDEDVCLKWERTILKETDLHKDLINRNDYDKYNCEKGVKKYINSTNPDLIKAYCVIYKTQKCISWEKKEEYCRYYILDLRDDYRNYVIVSNKFILMNGTKNYPCYDFLLTKYCQENPSDSEVCECVEEGIKITAFDKDSKGNRINEEILFFSCQKAVPRDSSSIKVVKDYEIKEGDFLLFIKDYQPFKRWDAVKVFKKKIGRDYILAVRQPHGIDRNIEDKGFRESVKKTKLYIIELNNLTYYSEENTEEFGRKTYFYPYPFEGLKWKE